MLPDGMPERMYLYIMGRGHSGSTILDILLGGNAAVESIGELVSGLAGYHHGMICACGCAMCECPFWTEVRHRFEEQGLDWDELIRATTTQAHLRSQPRTWLARSDDAGFTRLAQLTEGLQKAVAGRTGKAFLLDSGKEVTRALFLLRFLPRVRVIHLVRDPRAVQQSHYWRIAERRGFKFLRHKYQATWTGPFFLVLAAASWLVGNLLAEAVCRVAPGRTVRLRYEELRDDPIGTLRGLGGKLGLDLDDVIGRVEGGEPFAVGHNVGGNHIRHEQQVRFDGGTERTRRALPAWVGAVTVAICWPLMLHYGYRGRATARPTIRPAAATGGPGDGGA